MHLVQCLMAMALIPLFSACAITEPTVKQQDLVAWLGISIEALDTHTQFSIMPMFRTNSDSGTEIRNYAYGYNFGECFAKAGASHSGDFVDINTFITCSSSRIVCNNLFYIKEGKILEYAPTGRCNTDRKTQPERRYLQSKI